MVLNLDESKARIVISALLSRIHEMELNEFILEDKVNTLIKKNSCLENPNTSESEADNNG